MIDISNSENETYFNSNLREQKISHAYDLNRSPLAEEKADELQGGN